MPCRYDELPHEAADSQRQRDAKIIAKAVNSLKDQLEPLLCSACRSLEQYGFDFDTNPLLSRWWAKHKLDDAERERKENAKRLKQEQLDSILAKPFKDLTEEEKKILKTNKLI